MLVNEILTEASNLVRPETEQYMTQRGYTHLASGSSGDIWVKDAQSVTKVVLNARGGFSNSPLRSFIDYILKNPNDPHLPKIFPANGKLINDFAIGDRQYFEINMEKLQPASAEGQMLVKAIALPDMFISQGLRAPGAEWYEKLRLKLKGTTKQLPQQLLAQVPSFIHTASGLSSFAKKHSLSWDMGPSNVMQRGDGTLVINDPFGGQG